MLLEPLESYKSSKYMQAMDLKYSIGVDGRGHSGIDRHVGNGSYKRPQVS